MDHRHPVSIPFKRAIPPPITILVAAAGPRATHRRGRGQRGSDGPSRARAHPASRASTWLFSFHAMPRFACLRYTIDARTTHCTRLLWSFLRVRFLMGVHGQWATPWSDGVEGAREMGE